MITVLEGLMAGTAHVFAGPDHLVGVAPLAVDRPRPAGAWRVGATWGLGHGLSIAALGLAGQALLGVGEVEIASAWAERLVGIVLIVLGSTAIRRGRRLVVHEHVHAHGGETHVHLHAHEDRPGVEKLDDPAHRRGHRHAAFGVGVVHGLAGAGHLLAVLPSLAMSPPDAATFIASYIAASVAAMAVFSALIGRLAQSLGTAWLPRFLQGVGAVTLVVGVVWTLLAFGIGGGRESYLVG